MILCRDIQLTGFDRWRLLTVAVVAVRKALTVLAVDLTVHLGIRRALQIVKQNMPAAGVKPQIPMGPTRPS